MKIKYEYYKRKKDNDMGKQAGVLIYKTIKNRAETQTGSVFLPASMGGEDFISTVELYRKTWANDMPMLRNCLQAYMADCFNGKKP